MATKQIGNFGERIAENYLKNKGYQILDKNYLTRFSGSIRGEIDLIAKKDDIISFIEVKTLKSVQGKLFSPEEKVDFEKQRKLKIAAQSWLIKKKIPLNTKWQIDIISIKLNSNSKKAKIRHFKNISF